MSVARTKFTCGGGVAPNVSEVELEQLYRWRGSQQEFLEQGLGITKLRRVVEEVLKVCNLNGRLYAGCQTWGRGPEVCAMNLTVFG